MTGSARKPKKSRNTRTGRTQHASITPWGPSTTHNPPVPLPPQLIWHDTHHRQDQDPRRWAKLFKEPAVFHKWQGCQRLPQTLVSVNQEWTCHPLSRRPWRPSVSCPVEKRLGLTLHLRMCTSQRVLFWPRNWLLSYNPYGYTLSYPRTSRMPPLCTFTRRKGIVYHATITGAYHFSP